MAFEDYCRSIFHVNGTPITFWQFTIFDTLSLSSTPIPFVAAVSLSILASVIVLFAFPIFLLRFDILVALFCELLTGLPEVFIDFLLEFTEFVVIRALACQLILSLQKLI
jgi:hypothetical protein